MRIISGNYKGRSLKTLDGDNTRPTTDRVKESMFDILQFRIKDSVVLDLFAGSGALGIECLSRGAKFATFCDKEPKAIEYIKYNLRRIESGYKIINDDFKIALKGDKKYDIIFIDAPYRSKLASEALVLIEAYKVLNEGGIICYERLHEMPLSNLPNGLKLTDTRKYGKTAVDFIEYENMCDNGEL